MGEMVAVQGPRKKRLLCPATWDGLAAYVILARNFDDIETPLFFHEDRIGDLLQYPAFLESSTDHDVLIAGFPLPDSQIESALASIRRSDASKIEWYSHHFWSVQAANAVTEAGVALVADPRQNGTAELLLNRMEIDDELSYQIASAVQDLPRKDTKLEPWIYAFIGVQRKHYEIRHALEPLLQNPPGAPEPHWVAEGRAMFAEIHDLVEQSAHFRIDAGSEKIVVAGIPASLMPYHRLIVRLLVEKLLCSLVVLFVDGAGQIMLIRPPLVGADIRFLELTEAMEAQLELNVRLYNRNVALIGPTNDIRSDIDKCIAALRNVLEKS